MKSEERLLTTREAAQYLAISFRTLEKLRCIGSGPPFVSIAPRAVRYQKSALDAWIASRSRHSTSDQGPGQPPSPLHPAA